MNINLKDIILDIIYSEGYTPSSKHVIFELAADKTESIGYDEFLGAVSLLDSESRIIITKKGKIVPPESEGLYRGIFRGTDKRFSFVQIEENHKNVPHDKIYEKDIFIAGKNSFGAVNGDKVLVKLTASKTHSGKKEAAVQKILKRSFKKIVGVLSIKNGEWFIISKKNNGVTRVFIEENNIHGAMLDDLAEVEITYYPYEEKIGEKRTKKETAFQPGHHKRHRIYGKILRVLGAADSVSTNYEVILIEHGIRTEFGRKLLADAEIVAAMDSTENAELLSPKNRLDLREKLIFSIDGEDSKDLDDAISIETDENGNYILGVHIADVSHYVKRNSRIDKSAFERGTSTYFADKVVPMLPPVLSNGICSLNENVDRLCLSAFMTVDKSGKTISAHFEKTIINSKIRGVYSEFNRIFEFYDANKSWKTDDEQLNEKYKPVIKTVPKMRKLAQILKKRRVTRGALELESIESKFIMEHDHLLGETVPVDIKPRKLGESEGIIEEFMLCANEAVADYLFWGQYPCVYRIHENPLEEKISSFIDTAVKMGVTEKKLYNKEVSQSVLQKILKTAREKSLFTVINTLLLRSMAKAKYSPDCVGHYGLACERYLHFTSPIRRYPDLAVHRILKLAISGGFTKQLMSEYKDFVKVASAKSSEREVASLHAERDIEDLYKCVYMKKHIGEEFEGRISGITSFGFFVSLANTCEGLVRTASLKGFYKFDRENYELTSHNGKSSFKIGQTVQIKVVATIIESQTIDFELITKG